MPNNTLKNLVNAFIGESQARNKYTYYAKIAQKEGYIEISRVFLETAENELVHAKRIYEFIQEFRKDGDVKLTLDVDTSSLVYGNTKENLIAAISGETHEYKEMYPEYADTAEKEGYKKIADRLKAISIAEKNHQDIFSELLDNLNNGEVFKKSEKVFWVCMECGYVYYGDEAPEVCPSCNHPKAYFKMKRN